MTVTIGRRELLAALGGAAAAWPLGARAQQSGGMRRIGVLTVFSKDDPEGQRRIAALLQRLQELGWVDGLNVRIEFRWAGGGPDQSRCGVAVIDCVMAAGAPRVGPFSAPSGHRASRPGAAW